MIAESNESLEKLSGLIADPFHVVVESPKLNPLSWLTSLYLRAFMCTRRSDTESDMQKITVSHDYTIYTSISYIIFSSSFIDIFLLYSENFL